MRTELKKYFTHGFILTEQELWRINDDMVQQMERETNDDIISFFEIKYKNGVRAEKASLNEIISENNSGKWEVQEYGGRTCQDRIEPILRQNSTV